jgi:exosortase
MTRANDWGQMTHARKELETVRPQGIAWAAAAVLAVVVAATYWSPLAALVDRWYNDPSYIHGFVVPVFSALLLWLRRGMLQEVKFESNLWGLLLMVVAGAMRMISSYYYYDLLDPASLVPCLAGLALFVGGWNAIRWAWPSIVFLVFMVPLPGFLATLMGQPLQRFATIASTWAIQTIGISAVAEGNVIYLSDSSIGVIDACNGLRNMMLFLTVCVGVTFVIRRSLIEKVIIIISSAGIALVANVIRITATAVLQETFKIQPERVHEWAGLFMMPLAVVLLWFELAYLSHVFVPRSPIDPDTEYLMLRPQREGIAGHPEPSPRETGR